MSDGRWVLWPTLRTAVLGAVCLATTMPAAWCAEAGLPVVTPTRQEAVQFEAEVLPFLAANCTACHNAKVREGGLMLDSVPAILKGGDSGSAAVAGKPAESLIFLRAAHRQDDAMPPADNKVGAKNLSPQQLGLLERWIAEGAKAGPPTARQPIAWRPLPPAAGGVVAVAITADGRRTAAARGSRVTLFDTGAGLVLGELVDLAIAADAAAGVRAHRDLVSAVAFAPSGDLLATGSYRTIKLWRRRPPTRVAEIADSAQATAVAVAADGGQLAIGLMDGRILVCEAATGRVGRVLTAHKAAVTGVAFSADAAMLYSAGRDGLVLSTRVADGATVGRLERSGEVRAIEPFAGDARLAVAEADNVVRVWALPLPGAPAGDAGVAAAPPAALVPLKELGGMSQPTTVIVELPTMSGHLLTGSGDGIARLWNADAGTVVRQFTHGGPIIGMAMRPDGSRLATVGSVIGLKLWDTAAGTLVAETKGDHRLADRQRAFDVTLSVDRQDVEFATAQVAAAEKAVQAAAEEAKQAAEKVVVAEKAVAEKVAAAAAAKRAREEADAVTAQATAAVTVATEIRDTATKVAAAATATAEAAHASLAAARKSAAGPEAESIKPLEAATTATTAAKAAADQAVVQAVQQIDRAKARVDETTKKATEAAAVGDAADAARNQAETGLMSAKRAVEFAAELGKRSAAEVPLRKADLTAAAGRLATDEEARKKLDAEAAAAAQACSSAAFSSDGAWLACGGVDGRLAVLSAADGQPRLTWEGGRPAGAQGTPGVVAFAGGKRLVVAGAGAAAAIWDASEPYMLERTIGGELTSPAADDAPTGPPVDLVTSLAFSPDGMLLASGGGRASRSGEIKFWKVLDGGLVRALPLPHSDTVMALEFSRRGDLLASGAADRFLKVHAVADGRHVRSFEGHTGHVLGVAWQANGRRLASAGADNAVKVWDFVTGEQQRTIAGATKEVTAVRFFDAGEEFVAASATPSLRTINAGSGAIVREFASAGDFVQSLAVATPFVAAGAQDGRLRIWNLATGAPLHTLEPGTAENPGTSAASRR